jgi:hypothetical protein
MVIGGIATLHRSLSMGKAAQTELLNVIYKSACFYNGQNTLESSSLLELGHTRSTLR